MKGLERILNRATVLVVRMGKDGDMALRRIELVRKRQIWGTEQAGQEASMGDVGAEKFKNPVLVVVTGAGVVRKVYDCNQTREIERVTENEAFVWNCGERENGERMIDFTRKDRIVSLSEAFETDRVPVVDIYIGGGPGREVLLPEEEDIRAAAEWAVKRFYRENAEGKQLLGSGKTGDVLAGLIAGKVKIPLLVCLLCLLLINYLWSASVREEYRRQQEVLPVLETNASGREKVSGEMARIMDEFKGEGKTFFSLLSDRIASLVPPEVNLETLVVNPLIKSIEEKKPLMIREGYIGLTGSTAEPEKVTVLTGSLAGCDFARQVKLLSLDRDRETGLFHFNIWIVL